MQKRFFSIIALGVIIILTISGLTACGNDKKSEVILDFVWFSDSVEGEVVKSIINDYEEINKNITINLIEVPYKELRTTIECMISEGKTPAFARVSNPRAYSELSQPLNDYYDENITDQFVISLKPYYTIGEEVLAIPTDATVNGMIYNKTLFDKAGVDVPLSRDDIWNWDECVEAVKIVKDKGGAQYGILWDASPQRWSTILYDFGGRIVNKDGTKMTINNEKGIAVLEYFKRMNDEDVVTNSVWLNGEDTSSLFRAGEAAIHFSGNWMMANYRDLSNFEWGVTYVPTGENRSSVPSGKFVLAFKDTGVEEETVNFIKYLTSKEVNARYCTESLLLSPRVDNNELEYQFGKEFFEIFAEELNNTPEIAAEDWSKQNLMPVIYGDVKTYITEVIRGKYTVKEALDNVAAIGDDVIKKNEK
ncbi:sugar ABC transporter substrate-binding protein [Clostridium sediminicola]|uniref:ABC transporter substrate-binding protein n=1 Tax=Clostridium sediminicola TaxID=3114879 RepID=UPI0031F25421